MTSCCFSVGSIGNGAVLTPPQYQVLTPGTSSFSCWLVLFKLPETLLVFQRTLLCSSFLKSLICIYWSTFSSWKWKLVHLFSKCRISLFLLQGYHRQFDFPFLFSFISFFSSLSLSSFCALPALFLPFFLFLLQWCWWWTPSCHYPYHNTLCVYCFLIPWFSYYPWFI